MVPHDSQLAPAAVAFVLLLASCAPASAPLRPASATPFWSDVAPVSSPDGRRIAFASNRTGHVEVYTMNLDGSDVVQLTELASTSHPSSWSPDGREILIESEVSGDRELYALASDGSAMRRLTDSPGRDSHPHWAPDGSRIYFYSERNDTDDIYSMDADGGDVRRLTNAPGVDMMPVPSPDGTRIVFGSDRTGDREIFLLHLDGSGLTRLTDSPGFDGWADWSPDGSTISFTSQRDDGDYEIYLVNPDGTGLRRLTDSPGLDYQSAWTADGRALVIRSDRDGRPSLTRLDISGSSPQKLTNTDLSDFTAIAWRDGLQAALEAVSETQGSDLPVFHENEALALARANLDSDPGATVRLLELGVEVYPESITVLLALGDAYLSAGDKTRAVSSFERAVALDGNQQSVEALRRARAD